MRNNIYEKDVFDMDYDPETFESKVTSSINKTFEAIFKTLNNTDESYRYIRADKIA